MKKLILLVKSARPAQWVKNGIVFAPLVFSRHFTEVGRIIDAAEVFFAFCLVAAAVYLFNDLLDAKSDRLHPQKKYRPIASGQLSPGLVVAAIIIFAACGLGLSWISGHVVLAFTALYLAINIVYTLLLKHVVIIDVMTIAAGFVLRIFAGGFAIDVSISYWLILCTILLALFLGFGKRRHELVVLSGESDKHRKILSEYSTYFLDQMMAVVTSSTVIAYSLYTIDPAVGKGLGTDYLPVTIPFVLYGIFRYLYLIHQREEGGSPTRILLTDGPLIIDIGLWIVTIFILLVL